MKVVLPVLYCPSSNTEGLASKSDSDNKDEKKLPNLYASSRGRICSSTQHTLLLGHLALSCVAAKQACMTIPQIAPLRRAGKRFWIIQPGCYRCKALVAGQPHPENA